MRKAINSRVALTAVIALAMFVLFGCQNFPVSPNDLLVAPDEGVTSEVASAYDDEVQEITISNPNYIEDAGLDPFHPYHNFGAHDGGRAACKNSVQNDVFLIRLTDLYRLIPQNSQIVSCKMYFYMASGDGATGNKRVAVYEVLKPWVEGPGVWNYQPEPGEGSTFYKWDGRSSWGQSGCHLEDDSGVPNIGNGTGADCKATPVDVINVERVPEWPSIVPGYREFDINPVLVQTWLTQPENNGLVLKTLDINSWVHLGSKEAPPGQKPYFVIEYKEPAIPVQVVGNIE